MRGADRFKGPRHDLAIAPARIAQPARMRVASQLDNLRDTKGFNNNPLGQHDAKAASEQAEKDKAGKEKAAKIAKKAKKK